MVKVKQFRVSDVIHAIPLECFSDWSLKHWWRLSIFGQREQVRTACWRRRTMCWKMFASWLQESGVLEFNCIRFWVEGVCLMDIRNQFILRKWSEMQGTVYVPSNNDEELMSEVAKSTTTYLLLAVLVHRRILIALRIQQRCPQDPRARLSGRRVKQILSKEEWRIKLRNFHDVSSVISLTVTMRPLGARMASSERNLQ